MLPISPAELAQMQADVVAAACDKPCEILRATSSTADGYGSGKPAYTLIKKTVCGMTQPGAGELQNYAYIIGDKAAWTVRLPIGTDVRPQDHLIVDGETLEVHVLLQPRSFQALLSVIAAEIK